MVTKHLIKLDCDIPIYYSEEFGIFTGLRNVFAYSKATTREYAESLLPAAQTRANEQNRDGYCAVSIEEITM